MKKCRVCGIQIAAKPLAVEENLTKMGVWTRKAVKEFKPHLIVFPESITTTFAPGIPAKNFLKYTEQIPGRSTEFISGLCKELNVDIVLPMYERQKDKIYNVAVYINKKGEIKGIYRKIHLFPTERHAEGGWAHPGKDIVIVDTDFGKVGLMICYDGDFPELARILALRGAEIIVRPSALLRSFDIWDLTNKARAYDNHVHVVAVNTVGPDGDANYYFGHSMIVDPNAHKLALARGSEEIVFAELKPDKDKTVSYGINAKRKFDHIKDRNLDSYTDELLKPALSLS
ncbi:MAG: carbon-nitrogen hydrolase family protein [Armatimonadota bacterium]